MLRGSAYARVWKLKNGLWAGVRLAEVRGRSSSLFSFFYFSYICSCMWGCCLGLEERLFVEFG